MIRISKLSDYGIVIMIELAKRSQLDFEAQGGSGRLSNDVRAGTSGKSSSMVNAQILSKATGVPHATTSKILKMLTKSGLIEAKRGSQGGHELRQDAASISIADVIEALEGPIALTDCVTSSTKNCSIEDYCMARPHWDKINRVIRSALAGVSLLDMSRPGQFSQLSAQSALKTTPLSVTSGPSADNLPNGG